MASGFVVKVDDETAETLTDRYSDERITEALTATLEELANEPDRRQSELRREVMNLPEQPAEEEDELSGEELREEIRKFIRGKRDTDPRL